MLCPAVLLRLVLPLLLVCMVLSSIAFADDRRVVLTTLEWPPYSGENLPGQGASVEIVRAAFAAMGYEVEFRFLPWLRAYDQALHSHDVDGIFPEYYSAERAKHFIFSDVIGKSYLGFAQRINVHRRWESINDLARYKIGVVKGYVNTPEFDQMVGAGRIEVDASVSDLFNLRKVAAGRVDMSVVDLNVFRYLMHTDRTLQQDRGQLYVNSRLLGVSSLHVAFRNGRSGENIQRIFNQGLRTLHVMDMQRRYIDYMLLDLE